MPTSSLQQTTDAAAILLAITSCVPNEVADTHVAALLVTVTFAVASAAFMPAPVAGVIEEAVRAAAMSAPGAAAFAAKPLDITRVDEGAKRW